MFPDEHSVFDGDTAPYHETTSRETLVRIPPHAVLNWPGQFSSSLPNRNGSNGGARPPKRKAYSKKRELVKPLIAAPESNNLVSSTSKPKVIWHT